MDAIRDTFFQECEEQLSELETGLLEMQDGAADIEVVNAVFRAVHSIKGGAGAFGLDALVRFAHLFETALDEVRCGRLVAGAAMLQVLLRAADVLADLVRAARSGESLDPERSRSLAVELAALTNAKPTAVETIDETLFQPLQVIPDLPVPPAATSWSVRFAPHASMYAKANDAALLLRELGRLGAITVSLDMATLPLLDALDAEGAYLAWSVTLETDETEAAIREVFEFVDGDCDLTIGPAAVVPTPSPAVTDPSAEFDVMALIAQAQAAVAAETPNIDAAPPLVVPPSAMVAAGVPSAQSTTAAPRAEAVAAKPTIRVDLDRVDRLIDLVGELVINQAMLAERVMKSGINRSSNVAVGLEDLEHLTRAIQDSVMAIRAQPVKSVFQRMPRLAREVASMTGKQVRLVSEGEGTEVDRTVIEHLADPLTHMIRNAIDHGLESPEVRRAAGKPPEGTVRIAALHRSGRIVIEVGDDGAGINRSRVHASAVAKGLVAADATLSDDEIDNLIFLPGFSTADSVSDISGRGVGMDVVRRSIQALGGRISIASRPGLGSTFTLSLPLTLAVLDGMVVSVQGQTLVVPLTAIIETLQPREGDVHSLGGGARVIAIRGSFVPLIDVGSVLGFATEPAPVLGSVALLIEGEDGSRGALLVGSIHGQRQVVIKSLEANYRHVPGVAAATILGDGRVALILDVDAIAASPRIDLTPTQAPAWLALEAVHA